MNDALSGQLCDARTVIPAYARPMLWIDSLAGTVPVEGEKGLFTLPTASEMVTLRWGQNGPALARLPWRPDSLEWDGSIRIGGVIDALHMAPAPEGDGGLVVLYLAGYPLRPGALAYPARRDAPISPPDYFAGIDDTIDESFTTWVATDETPALALAQDALVSKLDVWCFGRLAGEKSRWHERLALPIWLSEMTAFAP